MKTGKRICAVVVAIALVIYISTYGIETTSISKAKEKNKKTTYIVQLEDGGSVEFAQKTFEESKETNLNGEHLMEEEGIVALCLAESEKQELEKRTNVSYIEKDFQVEGSVLTESGSVEDVPKFHKKKVRKYKRNKSKHEWNIRMIHADKIEKRKKSNDSKVKIAILDSGVDYGNDIELAASVTLVPGEEEMSPLFMDGSGHGNSVAGLVAALDNEEGITGVNPEAEIYSIRVLDNNNQAPVSRVIEGIYMAIEQNVHIINLSFGMDTYSHALQKAIRDASDAGILIVAAAGNTGNSGVQYPAAYDEVIAVGSVDKMGEVVESSARGNEIEVVAPGDLVRSTGTFGDELVASGTSLAAPQVSAIASLIWQKDLGMSADFVRWAINEGANAYGEKEAYGNGLVDAEYILTNYHELKARYEEGKAEDGNVKNEREIIGFEDTGCVEGSWTVAKHGDMVGSDYANVKAGARFPDNTSFMDTYGKYRFAKISHNPWWHGTYQQSNNYVAAYIYATNMANAIGQGKMPHDASIPSGCTYATDMLSDVNAIGSVVGWGHSAVLNGREPTAGRRRAFVWGMGIHTLADTYAHSAYVHDSSGWHHLAHEDGKGYDVADDPTKYQPRYDNAVAAVKKSLAVYNNKYAGGTYNEFSTVIGQNVYKLRNISAYITTVAGYAAAQPYVAYSYSPSTGTK